jgi:predicted site-specific integrase-resolvase
LILEAESILRTGTERFFERAIEEDIEDVAITHKNRLCIIAYDLFEFILNKLGVKIKVMIPSGGLRK